MSKRKKATARRKRGTYKATAGFHTNVFFHVAFGFVKVSSMQTAIVPSIKKTWEEVPNRQNKKMSKGAFEGICYRSAVEMGQSSEEKENQLFFLYFLLDVLCFRWNLHSSGWNGIAHYNLLVYWSVRKLCMQSKVNFILGLRQCLLSPYLHLSHCFHALHLVPYRCTFKSNICLRAPFRFVNLSWARRVHMCTHTHIHTAEQRSYDCNQ